MMSNHGGWRTENHSTSPASGAQITWSTESGDGYLSGYGTTDAAGQAQATLTMGSVDTVARVEVSYASGHATSATLLFTAAPPEPAPESWTFLWSEYAPAIVNLAVDGPLEVAHGEQRVVSGMVQLDVWDIWVDGNGTVDRRYNHSSPLNFAPVSFTIEWGDASLSAASTATDGQGQFSVAVTMGASSSRLAVAVDGSAYAAPPAVAAVEFTPAAGPPAPPDPTPVWQYLRTDGQYSFGPLSIDGPTYDVGAGETRSISGTVQWHTWQVWVDQWGNTETREPTSAPADLVTLNAQVETGDGLLSSAPISTGVGGSFSTTFTMGSQESRVRVWVDAPEQGAVVVFTPAAVPPPVEETWSLDRTERTIAVTVTTNSPAEGLVPDSVAQVRAQVLETSWEVWRSNQGNDDLRNQATGPAIGAMVTFGVASGPGHLSASTAVTDADGIAWTAYTMGTEAAVVAASASYLATTASGDLHFHPGSWVYDHSDATVSVSLATTGNPASGVAATVQYHSWEVWRNLDTNALLVRNESQGPAGNAEVVFSFPSATTGPSLGQTQAMTGIDGVAATAYLTGEWVWLQASATFAGVTASAQIELPPTGDGGGTGGDGGGGGGDGTGGGGGGGGGAGGNPPGGGGNPTGAPEMPRISMKGRSNSTSGGGGTPPEDENPDPENGPPPPRIISRVAAEDLDEYWDFVAQDPIYHFYVEQSINQDFVANLTRPVFDFDGETPLPPETMIAEGRLEDREAILAPFLADRWEVESETETNAKTVYDWTVFFEGDLEETGHHEGSGEPFVVTGKSGPYDPETILTTLADADEVKALYEAAGTPQNPMAYWMGSVGDMSLNPGSWGLPLRIAYGHSGAPKPEPKGFASFASELFPSVRWTELWFQAETAIPAGAGNAKRTMLIHASSHDQNDVKTEWFGTATFTIREGQQISDPPVIQGLAAEVQSWVGASSEGSIVLKPPVERGKSNMVNLLPDIEIKVEFDPSGTMGFDKVTDAVRLTATRVEILARGASETNFSASDRLVASTLQLEPGDEQVTLDPFLLVAPIGGGTGDGEETQNCYSLSSQSTGIGGTADQFEMVYYVGSGDFDIHARLASFGNTVAASKAGLMVRDNAGEGAVFGMVAVNGSNNFIFEYRDESGEASQTISGGTAAATPWLRLTRQGGTVRAYTSADGQSWQQIGNGAALTFAPDSLVGMCLSSGSATTTSTAEFTNVDLPLSSNTLTISDEITPGSYATYKIRIHDPRQSGIDNFKIDDQEVSLTRTGNYYESEEFICTIDGERLDVEGVPEKVIYLRSEAPMGEYNPIWPFKSDPKPLPGPAGYRVVADLIDQSVKEMEANPSSWTATNDGSFGTEVHKRVSSKLQNKSGWLVDVYVENGTNRILSIGNSPGSTTGTTQIDVLHLKSGYKPKVGQILDSSKIENLFEIKTSISGKIASDQKARLKAVMGGGKIVVAKSPKRWTMASGWEPNKRFGAGFKLLSLVGVGSAVYAILNYDDEDEELDALIAEAKQINGISDPDWKKASTIVWMGSVRNWLSQFFPDSTVVDLAIVGVIYTKVLPGEEFQPD
jgi:regulation of enolase protein 1 (concanavalin A-like superfamily)